MRGPATTRFLKCRRQSVGKSSSADIIAALMALGSKKQVELLLLVGGGDVTIQWLC